MTDARHPSGPTQIPIVVGVSGHRDLNPAHTDALETRVSDFLRQLRADHPHSPVVVLTALAEGADQLAARVAMRHGLGVVALLPMPAPEYEHDFETEDRRAEFRRLLAGASGVIEMPAGGRSREQMYDATGAAIARRCLVLLALWDGGPPGGPGGTADVVGYKLRGSPPRLESPAARPLDPPEKGPVVHIVTPRAGQPCAGQAGAVHHLQDDPGEWDRTERMMRSIDAFNRDAPHPGATSASARAVFEAADALAIRLQRRALRTLHALMLLALSGSLCFGAYSSISPPNRWLLGGYLIFLLVSFWVWLRRIRREEIDARYLDVRALAEGLRVHAIWTEAGLDEDAADRYLRKQRTDLDWIRAALRAVALPDGPTRPPGFTPARAEASLRAWIDEQRAYFAKAGRRTHALNTRFAALARWAYAGAVVTSVTHFVLMLAGESADLLLLPIALLLVVVVLSELYANKRVLAEHAKRYARMRELFAMADRHLGTLGSLPEPERAELVRTLLLELGSEALAENAEWLLIHRERPVDFAM